MQQQRLLVGVDVGCRKHNIAIGGPSGIVDQFEITHDSKGFQYFFSQVAAQARRQKTSIVVVGMEGTNGYARPFNQMVGPMISDDAKRILQLKEKIDALETQMEALVGQSSLATLLKSIPGFGTVCAAEISGEIGTMDRFNSESGLAIYLGMAPLDNSSGNYKGSKSPHQVNKRAKAAMMVAMGHHIRKVAETKTYYEKKRAEGKKYNQSLRSLGRHLTRVICIIVINSKYKKVLTKPAGCSGLKS